MLDINFIRENSGKVKEACEKKQVKVDVDKVLELDKKKRELMTEMETLKAEQNKISRLGSPKSTDEGGGGFKNEPIIVQAKEIKGKIKEMEPELEKIEKELRNLLLQLPNIPFDEVPVGKDDSENVVLRKIGHAPKFIFHKPKDYMELGSE